MISFHAKHRDNYGTGLAEALKSWAQSRRALARGQFINIHCITSFYELSVDDGKIAFFPKKIFGEKRKKG